MKNIKGFTLLELLVYMGILGITSSLMVGVLSTLVRVQNQSSSTIEVSNQSQFLLQTIQRKVRDSSQFSVKVTSTTSPLDQDASPATGSALRLRMSDPAEGIVNIYLANGTVYLSQENETTSVETVNALTNSRVNVTSFSLTKNSNPPGHDILSVNFVMAYNTSNPQLAVSRTFQSAISRVSAAVFDSNLLPAAAGTKVGTAAAPWDSGYFTNDIITSGGKIGVKNTSPTYDVDITGGLRVTATTTFSGNVGIGTLNVGTTTMTGANVGTLNVGTTTMTGANGSITLKDGTLQGVGIELHIRPSAGGDGLITFTENAVADNWRIGTQNGSTALYFLDGVGTQQAILGQTGGSPAYFGVNGWIGAGCEGACEGTLGYAILYGGGTMDICTGTSCASGRLIFNGTLTVQGNTRFESLSAATSKAEVVSSGISTGFGALWFGQDSTYGYKMYTINTAVTSAELKVDFINRSTGNATANTGTVDFGANVEADFDNTATLAGVCHSGTDSDTTAADRLLVVCSGAPGDIAEFYEAEEGVEKGDVVVVTDKTFSYKEILYDPWKGTQTGEVADRTVGIMARTSMPYQENLLGVISESPFQAFGKAVIETAKNSQPVALTGRVPVKISLENGSIKSGDQLTSASRAGYAMKATKTGKVLGTALQEFNADSEGEKIMVFVNPHYWVNPQDYLDMKARVERLEARIGL